MTTLLRSILLGIAVAALVGLGCLLLGAVLVTLNIPVAVTVGSFLQRWAWVIGLLAGLWQYLTGGFAIP